jgi:hypothetical protein
MRARNLFTIVYLAGGLAGCGAVTEADRMLARELMAQSGSNCIHISGGSVMGVLPMAGGVTGGGYRGSLSAAHSESDTSLECTADRSGAK